MRWLALALGVSLLACEPRVIVTRMPAPTGGQSASGAPSPSASASAAPAKVALRPVPSVAPATRLVSYERGGDVGPSSLRFVLTGDGRVVTEDNRGDLAQRRLTPSGAAALVLQAIETGLFDKDATYRREPLPGTTPPGRGTTVLILVVANGPREVRVSFEPSGQPDDELYQKSPTRDKLTALARGYDDLSWVPANNWADSRPQPYQPTVHRLFLLIDPNTAPGRSTPDAEAAWPFLSAIETVGDRVSSLTGAPWRCAVLVDDDALALGDALTRAAAITRYGWGSNATMASLAWRGTGTLRLQLGPVLPHERATCEGAAAPL